MLATVLVLLLAAVSAIFAFGGTVGIFTKEFWDEPGSACLLVIYILLNWVLSIICIYSLLIDWPTVRYAIYIFGAEIFAGWVALGIALWRDGIGPKEIWRLTKQRFSQRDDPYQTATFPTQDQLTEYIRDEEVAELEKEVAASSNSLPLRITSRSIPIIARAAFALGVLLVIALFWTFASSLIAPHSVINSDFNIWLVASISVGLFAVAVGRLAIRFLKGTGALGSRKSFSVGISIYAFGLLMAFYSIASAVTGWFPIADGAIWFILTFGVAVVAVDLGKTFMRPHLFASASDVRKNDPRPPVLYLRSFSRESRSAMWVKLFRQPKSYFRFADEMASWRIHKAFTNVRGSIVGPLTWKNLIQSLTSGRSVFDEQLVIANIMNRIGPYIAIARPGETEYWSDVGSAKERVSDSEWQRVVLNLIEESAAIVIEAGSSTGLLWEIQQVVETVPGTKVLLIVPDSDHEYERFCKITGDIFRHRLQPNRPISRLVTFNRDWWPITLPVPRLDETSSLKALSPFIEQNTMPWLKKPPDAPPHSDLGDRRGCA